MSIGGINIPLSLKALTSNEITLTAGQTALIPAGSWFIVPGPYTYLQFLDPVSGLWRNVAQMNGNCAQPVSSDGANFRLANLSGCAAGAVVTNAGSGYTSAPTVTASAGGSLWRAIVGGLVNTTATVPSQAGANYTYPPICIIAPPPAGGIQATAVATISGGAVNGITITNQGAGYVSAPQIWFVADPRDPNNPVFNPNTTTAITPCGAAVSNFPGVPIGTPVGQGTLGTTLTLTGANTIAAVVCTDPGTPQTSVPTLSFSGGGGSSAAATALMNFAVTGFTVVTAGSSYGNAQPFQLQSVGGVSAASAVHTQPAVEKGITQVRQARIAGTTTAGGGIQTAGSIIEDSGIGFQLVPFLSVIPAGNALPTTTAAQATATVGGVTDTVYLMPADA